MYTLNITNIFHALILLDCVVCHILELFLLIYGYSLHLYQIMLVKHNIRF